MIGSDGGIGHEIKTAPRRARVDLPEGSPVRVPRRAAVDLPEPAPVPAGQPRQAHPIRRAYKGDGMTGERPRLPSPLDPNAGPRRGFQVPNGGHGHGVPPEERGGMPRLPLTLTPRALAGLDRAPPLSSIRTVQAAAGPKIPDHLVGIPGDKFYAAYQAALQNGEQWARELVPFGKAELARVERTGRGSGPSYDVAGAHLAFCRAGGEPWAIVLSEERRRVRLPQG